MSISATVKSEILSRSKEMYEGFLAAVVGKKVLLDRTMFEANSPVNSIVLEPSAEGEESQET